MTHKTIEGRCVERIMEDLRDRRTLKWMFAKDPEHTSSMAIDLKTQAEIRRTWRKIIHDEIDKACMKGMPK